jgi:hypothetical protein
MDIRHNVQSSIIDFYKEGNFYTEYVKEDDILRLLFLTIYVGLNGDKYLGQVEKQLPTAYVDEPSVNEDGTWSLPVRHDVKIEESDENIRIFLPEYTSPVVIGKKYVSSIRYT